MTAAFKRGFDVAEFRTRVANAQSRMAAANLDALLLTTEPDVRYFSGFLTRFWESPTRPWFLLVPVDREPIAVIPSIGHDLMRRTWIKDIRTWKSPDLEDDGVSLLADTIVGCVASGGRIGVPMGSETHLRMPLADFKRLEALLKPRLMTDDSNIVRDLRMVKSESEIAKIRHACGIAGRAFARVGEFAGAGLALEQVFRRFQMTCLDEGADWVPYLAGGAGPCGYFDVISPATEAPLQNGDVLMMDTGLVWDGYFCDFDRNFSVGSPSARLAADHTRLIDSVHAGLEAAKPGAMTADVFAAISSVTGADLGDGEPGRIGHGLGMQLTEWPSIIAADRTVLQPGMVLTLEPSVQTGDGRFMTHEENIVIRDNGAELLSPLAGAALEVL